MRDAPNSVQGHQWYGALLSGIDGLELPCPDDATHERSWFVYVVKLPTGVDREAVITALDDRGVQTARYLPFVNAPERVRAAVRQQAPPPAGN